MTILLFFFVTGDFTVVFVDVRMSVVVVCVVEVFVGVSFAVVGITNYGGGSK